jgi:hypothetical protein
MNYIPTRREFLFSLLSAPLMGEGKGSPIDAWTSLERRASVNQFVAYIHGVSLKLREKSLLKTVSKDICWPGGVWGDNLWCLSALFLNVKVDEANARLLRRARAYLESKPEKNASRISPGQTGDLPWTFFSLADYVRTLYLFNSKSSHFPGRLTPETEKAMMQALWVWVKNESRIDEATPNDLFLLIGTENIDLNRRSAYYLVTALLNQYSEYRHLRLNDGHTVAEHADAYTKFYQLWPRSRAETGLWVEVGSTTYQKYSWPILFNLHDLSPDPIIRDRFRLLLDLAFVEEEQISVRGRRGGGLSRGDYDGPHTFELYKNLLFAPPGQAAGSTHSRVIETSPYQLPAAAILLRYRTFPAPNPLLIQNRVLGELACDTSTNATRLWLARDSALVNYAYRTPHYLLGCTLLNPTLDYAGISNQERACGMLFDNPSAKEIYSVHSFIKHGPGGRPQRSFWSVQNKNVLIIQRIPPGEGDHKGSYNTDEVGIAFRGKALQILEKDGWIFASDGKAFVGVKFLDGGVAWDAQRRVATPSPFDKAIDKSRILLCAGDISAEESFAKFQSLVLMSRLHVSPEKVEYQFGPTGDRISMNSYNPNTPFSFTMPRINGKPVNLRPSMTFRSPYLNGAFDSDKITMTVGSLTQVLNFSARRG